MSIKLHDLYLQYLEIKDEIDAAISLVIKKSAFIGGKFVENFEEEFAQYIGTSHCIGVGNGTDALEIALWACSFPANSEVLVPANSFVATAEAVINMNLKPVFVDVGDDFCIDVASAQRMLSEKTKAIIPVHLYGQPADMQKIISFAKENNLVTIEDCAQAHGAMYYNYKVGSFGDISCFSFYPGKNLGAFGDGGAILTNDDTLSNRIRMYKNHGRIEKYAHSFVGRNSRLDGLQAAVLSIKLKYLDNWIERRNLIADIYIKNLDITFPNIKQNIKHAWHLFVGIVKDRDALIDNLTKNSIDFGIHYPKLLPNLDIYSKFYPADYMSAQNFENHIISLPMHENLKPNEIQKIINVVNHTEGIKFEISES